MPRQRAQPGPDPLEQLDQQHDLPFDQFVTFQVNQLSMAFERQWTRFLRELAGVNLSEWRLLATLDGHGECTFTRLVQATGMNKALCSRSMHALEAMGYVALHNTPGDARSVTLALTARGRAQVARVRPHALARQRHLLAALSATQRQTFYEVVAKLRRAADSWPPEPARRGRER